MKRMTLILAVLAVVVLSAAVLSHAQPAPVSNSTGPGVAPQLPGMFEAKDFPGDKGNKIQVLWNKSPDDNSGRNNVKAYYLLRSTTKDGYFDELDKFVPVADKMREFEKAEASKKEKVEETFEYLDENIIMNIDYYYRVKVVGKDNSFALSPISGPVKAAPQWFNSNRLNVLIGSIIFIIIVLVCIFLAKSGKEFFVRKIAGIDAVDEAIGRATEMGKPILYISGLSSIGDIATLASINILGRVAKKVAEYETPLIVPVYDYFVMMVMKEVVKESYMEAGKPDAYRDDSVFFLCDSQFAYAAAVDGIMVRERPAANFYFGTFFAESLIMAETGASTGAIQIAGSDSLTQVPFFITACDYTLIGEELYAASAYLSKDPLLMGTLKSQDWGKLILMILLVIGIILVSFGVPFGDIFQVIE